MNKNYKPYVLILPFILIMCSTFVLGFINGITQSLGYMPYLNMNTFTIKYYGDILRDGEFSMSLLYSIYISIVSSAVSIALGVLVAFAILGLKKEHEILTFLYKTPIIMPHLVAVVLVFNIFSQTGIASRLVYNTGIIQDANQWPLIVFDKWGIGIILVYLYKQIPFITMTVFSILKNINQDFADVAYNLGANRSQVLFKVVLPLLAPTILSVFLIVFAFTFGAFEVPFLIGSPVVSTLPVKAYIHYTDPDFTYRAHTMVINVIISIISICFTWLYVKVFKHITKFGG